MNEFKDLDRTQRLRALRGLLASDGWQMFVKPRLERSLEGALSDVRNAAPDRLLAARETWRAWEDISTLVPSAIATLEKEEEREAAAESR